METLSVFEPRIRHPAEAVVDPALALAVLYPHRLTTNIIVQTHHLNHMLRGTITVEGPERRHRNIPIDFRSIVEILGAVDGKYDEIICMRTTSKSLHHA